MPSLAIVEDAAHHDSVRAEALCAALKEGDIVVADRAYTDFAFLSGLNERGVFFVVRSAIWVRRDLLEILAFYGIAGHCNRPVIAQKNQYVQGFLPFTNLPYGTA